MQVWVVNTNTNEENGNPSAFKYMLRQNKASAFWGKRKKIDPIKPHDLVLLYHNRNKFIGVGCVIESPSNQDYIKQVEHWIDVNWIWTASFDSTDNPTNFINKVDIGLDEFIMKNTVLNVTNRVDYKKLLTEMAKKQDFIF